MLPEKASSVIHRSSQIVTITECLPILFSKSFSFLCFVSVFSQSLSDTSASIILPDQVLITHTHTHIYLLILYSPDPLFSRTRNFICQIFYYIANSHTQFLNTYEFMDIYQFFLFLSSFDFHSIMHLCSCSTVFLVWPVHFSSLYK